MNGGTRVYEGDFKGLLQNLFMNMLLEYAKNRTSPSGLFFLDPESGVLSVAAPLSGKGRNEHYELTVRALDQGSPQLYSEATIRVLIGDVSTNDGVPTFVKPRPNEGASVMEVRENLSIFFFQIRYIWRGSLSVYFPYDFTESHKRQNEYQILKSKSD